MSHATGSMPPLPCDKRSTPFSADAFECARHIRLLVLDVDGVMTHGHLLYQADGQESKQFNTQDGLGLKLLEEHGIQMGIITGRCSPMVTLRAKELGITHLEQGRHDKGTALKALADQLGLPLSACAYCGDDLPDIGAIVSAGLGISVPNAPSYVREAADHVTGRAGGDGAVRELCELLLQAQGHWEGIMARYAGKSAEKKVPDFSG
ncbi:KdsC family phosphatase [Zymobacter sp. IVIA_5232.4 C2]|uniref:KdsC family phosphatase n=1 Tax=Zymobacter sp. IVIA_5232.4 C2 TaxID=3394855 RepID=UPI0039C1F555